MTSVRTARIAFLASVAGLITAWYLVAEMTDVPRYVLPPVQTFLAVFWQGLTTDPTSPASYWYHVGWTLGAALLGFMIGSSAGIVIATLVSQSPFMRAVVWPYVVGFQSVPKVAIAPLVLLWFGFGFQSQVVIVCLLTFFPLFINSIAGFRSPDPELLELMSSLGASRWQTFRTIQFPAALPYIFAGFELAIVFSLIGAIVAEFVGGNAGIGTLILRAQFSVDTASTFALLILLGAIGVLLSKLIAVLRRRIVFWSAPTQEEEGRVATA